MEKIIPEYKNGCETEVTNYRPIFLLSNIIKIIEKMVHDRLYMFLKQSNAFYNYQFGFRNIYSMNYAIIEKTEQKWHACYKNLLTCEVYLDPQKVFDTVNHEILLAKLKHYEIRGISYKWFQSFLCQRLKYNLIKKIESSLKAIFHGVPKGSILGSLLFILYINNMHNSLKNCNLHHFVNDTNLLLTNSFLRKISRQVNHNLSLISHWLRTKKIILNTSKIEITMCRPRKKQIRKHLNFRISG